MTAGLNPFQTIVFDVIRSAAEAGRECPTNTQLFDVTGCGISQGSEIISSLERKGLITVERGNSRRVVTIVATGKRTAGEITNRHWRDRPENAGKLNSERRTTHISAASVDNVEHLRVDRDPCFFCGARKDVCSCDSGKVAR